MKREVNSSMKAMM